ncbi:MAG: efflux transporter outer membrane subunit [Parachlamydiaceae bacterium]
MTILRTLCRFFSIISLLFFSGCSQFNPALPEFKQLPQYSLTEAIENNQSVVIVNDWVQEEWWFMFNDSQLSSLVDQAIIQHPSMTIAEARVRAANALRMGAQSPLYPSINSLGDYTRLRNSKNGIFGLAPQFPLTYTQPEVSLNFAYEFDFWKKHKNLIDAAIDEVEARKAEMYFSRLVLSLAVASSYFELQTTVARKEIALALLENQQKLIALADQRRSNGIDNEWDVNNVKTGILLTNQYVEQLLLGVNLSRNELQALIAGDFNSRDYCSLSLETAAFTAAYVSANAEEPFPLPESLPVNLLAHRADIWASERRAEAAARKICVARANFYPNINLLGFAGLQTITPSNFFQASSFYGSVGPAFNLPIFEGGALQAAYDASCQDYVIAVAEYEELLLNAVKEVLNALTCLDKTKEIYHAARTAEYIAWKNVQITKDRMKHHLSSKLDLLADENVWLQMRDISVQSFLNCLEAKLALIRALGGGF